MIILLLVYELSLLKLAGPHRHPPVVPVSLDSRLSPLAPSWLFYHVTLSVGAMRTSLLRM